MTWNVSLFCAVCHINVQVAVMWRRGLAMKNMTLALEYQSIRVLEYLYLVTMLLSLTYDD